MKTPWHPESKEKGKLKTIQSPFRAFIITVESTSNIARSIPTSKPNSRAWLAAMASREACRDIRMVFIV